MRCSDELHRIDDVETAGFVDRREFKRGSS